MAKDETIVKETIVEGIEIRLNYTHGLLTYTISNHKDVRPQVSIPEILEQGGLGLSKMQYSVCLNSDTHNTSYYKYLLGTDMLPDDWKEYYEYQLIAAVCLCRCRIRESNKNTKRKAR